MDVNWDDKEIVDFGKEFIKLVSDWAKDVKSTNELTVYSSKPKYWEDFSDVSIKRMQKNKISNLLTKDSISCDEWVEVSTNGNYLVIVADMHDAGSDYFDLVIEK